MKQLTARSAREIFRSKFQRSLRECVRHGFAVEESFGLVWEETLDEICLVDHEKAGVYEELITWARSLPARTYSPAFTGFMPRKTAWNRTKPA